MTENMQVHLHVHGKYTLIQIVDVTGIRSGRAYAVLQGPIREAYADSVTRGGNARFAVTGTGRKQVECWSVTSAAKEAGRA